MDISHAKKMMDAFYEAKRILDALPPLPEGLNRSCINTLDALEQMSESGRRVRVSDAADFQNLPRPGVTRTVSLLEKKGLLVKKQDPEDRRAVYLELTEQGREILQKYVSEYFQSLIRRLEGISNAETDEMIRTIHKIGGALK
jgi:DNA-binding MarR family transcriptional regulator